MTSLLNRISKTDVLHSKEDASVNFVSTGKFPGFVESRYVRRKEDYFIAYLSSQTGCKQACRFCHLTATGQTELVDLTPEEIIWQANRVLTYYRSERDAGNQPSAKIVHFSFMARGEPLANQFVLRRGEELVDSLVETGRNLLLQPRVMISTIIPQEFKGKSLADIFPTNHPNIYYSIYSMDPEFRKRWLPKALPAEAGLEILRDYQDHTNKIVRLHWAFIEGENDAPEDVYHIVDAVNRIDLRVDVNIVRYNPYSEKHGREPSLQRIEELEKILIKELPHSKIKIVDRVGRDVKASCGMFVKDEEEDEV